MKTFLTAVICFILVLVGLFVYLNYVENVCGELTKELDGILEEVSLGNWEKAGEKTGEFTQKWEKKRKTLSIFTDHAVNDVITENITALEYFIKAEDEGEVSARAGILKRFIENIYKSEKPSLANIL